MTISDIQVGTVDGPVVLTGTAAGYAVVPVPTPLTFLNYYDGKFLRASDLDQEQLAQRALVRLSNVAGGAGVVSGFDVSLGSNDTLGVSAGLAVAPTGDVLYLPQSISVSVSDLLAAMAAPVSEAPSGPSPGGLASSFAPCAPASPVVTVAPTLGSDLYLITVGLIEGLCGTDEVFGRLCDAACTTATDRPWRIDGVVIALVPLSLVSPLETSTAVPLGLTHLRSRVASAYFADEEADAGSLISGLGLRSSIWCAGATALSGSTLALGVLARSGTISLFVDEWTARRERVETTPTRYWAGHMAMRPWDVLLAQILQFQCQLRDVLANAPSPGTGPDPCAKAVDLLGQSTDLIERIAAEKPAPAPTPPTPAPTPSPPAPAAHAPAKKAPAKKSVAKKAPAKQQAAAKKSVAKKAGAKKSVAKKAGAKKSVAKKAGAKKSVAKKSAAKKAPAKRRPVRAAAANPRVSATVEPPTARADEELVITDVLAQAIKAYRKNVADVIAGEMAVSDRILIDGGIVELPPAGYLPVDLTGVVDLPTQVQRLLGPGLDLRFCTMRHDQAGFEVRKAQDLDRISMLVGIDDPTAKPQVDILVPDATWSTAPPPPAPAPAPGPTPDKDSLPHMGSALHLPIWEVPIPDQPTTATLVPSLDWVLFRRRSDLDCGSTTPVTPPVVVTVWDFQVDNQQGAGNDWQFLLTEPLEVKRMRWQQVGQATFTAGTADLLTTAAQIADWDTTGVGPHLAGAGYAASSGTDPQGIARAKVVVHALGLTAFKGLTPGFADLSAQTPPSGSDADIYLITYPDPPPSTCVDAWITSPHWSGQVMQAVMKGEIPPGMAPPEVDQQFHVDVVSDVADSGDMAQLTSAAAALKYGITRLVVWLSGGFDPTAEQLAAMHTWMDPIVKQVQAQSHVLPPADVEITFVGSDFDPVAPLCPVRLWVFPNPG